MSVHNYSGCVFWTGAWLALYQGTGENVRWDVSYFFLLTTSCGINCKEKASLNGPRLFCMHRQERAFAYVPGIPVHSERSNINPQPWFSSSWPALWTMQCYIWFLQKLMAQAGPRWPELAPKASRDPHRTTPCDGGGGTAERQPPPDRDASRDRNY